MLRSKRTWTIVLLTVASTLGAVYALQVVSGLRVGLAEYETALSDQRAGLARLEVLAGADSLLTAGSYRAARDAYRAMLVGEDLAEPLRGRVAARAEHAERLVAMRARLNEAPVRRRPPPPAELLEAPRPTAVRSVERVDLAATRPAVYDSLTFALEKSELQIGTLRRQLAQRSALDQLTFRSAGGNEVYYVGEVANGKANGQGSALLSTGSRYVGEWRENRKHGRGEFTWSDGARYEGEFREGERDGEGAYYFPSGEVYVGSWSRGLRSGPGKVYGKDGKVVAEGRWRDDELVAKRGNK